MAKSNRFFINFLAAYVLLILIPLIAGMAINNSIVREYEQHVRRAHLTHLKNTRDVLESFLEDVKWSTYQLAGNTKLLRLISDRDKSLSSRERNSLIRETMHELNSSLLYNTSFNSIFYVYLKDQDIIITPYSIYTHRDFNDSVNFFKMENVDSDAWHHAIESEYFQGSILPVRSMIIEDFKNKRMIPYVQSLPIDRNADPGRIDGAIVYLIGEADFVKFLDYEDLPEGGASYIADGNNRLISLVSKREEPFSPLTLTEKEGMERRIIDGKKMFVIHTTSSRNNWKYVSLLPEEWVMKSVSFYQLISFVVMFTALLFCLGAAWSLSRRWSHPLAQTFNSLSGYLDERGGRVSFGTLNSGVNELINRSEDLKGELMDQRIFVQNTFVNRLINGFFRSEANLNAYLDQLGISIPENLFSVAILSLEDSTMSGTAESFEELVRIRTIVKVGLQQTFSVRQLLSEQDNGNFVMVLMTESENGEKHIGKLNAAFAQFRNTLPSAYQGCMRVALGEAVSSLKRVHHSFLQAQDVLSRDDGGLMIRRFSELEEIPGEFYYPMEMESRLVNAVKAGNRKALAILTEKIFSENFERRSLDRNQRELFLYGLRNSCFRVINQLSPESRPDTADLDSPDFEDIRSFLMRVCSLQEENKKSHNSSLIDSIEEYLKANFSNRNLSLLMVAEHFSITESYLSFFFKEQRGVNFSAFLERLRMEHACELLMESDEPIHIIAGMAGYNSDKSFRRVFQKLYHTSPGQFREENSSSS